MGFDDNDLNNLKATELRLGLPGTELSDEQESSSSSSLSSSCVKNGNNKRSCEQMDGVTKAAPKAQVIGWPPVRSYRKNMIQKSCESEGSGTLVKVSMDGAPYLRKVDLCGYTNYYDLLKALENMFKCSIDQYSEREGNSGSEYVITYEDKDGDWMLAGDVPWDMFASSCKRLRIMKGSEAKGLGCL